MCKVCVSIAMGRHEGCPGCGIVARLEKLGSSFFDPGRAKQASDHLLAELFIENLGSQCFDCHSTLKKAVLSQV